MKNAKSNELKLIRMLRKWTSDLLNPDQNTTLLNSFMVVSIFIGGGLYLGFTGHPAGAALSLMEGVVMAALLHRDYKNRFQK
jgi:hypothetical protein